MVQLTLRIEEGLAEQLKAEAARENKSVNAYASWVLSAAVNPDLADTESERLRARLAKAGLLLTPEPMQGEPPPEADVARARAAAGKGRRLAEYVSEGRR